jgi:hypothetical protein
MKGKEYFKSTYGLNDKDFVMFPYGSRVYGTHSDKSDYDYNTVVSDNCSIKTGTEVRHHDINITVYSKSDWQQQLDNHKIHSMEAFYNPDGECRRRFNFSLNLGKLRNELSQKASHSFVKAKKKIEVERDFLVGWKSLFHSLRILNFGLQIATTEKIDFSAANHFWFDIIGEPHYDWPFFKQKYQPIYNELATEFRKVAPK